MPYKFNPFTGNLDLVNTATPSTGNGTEVSFVVGDWQLIGGLYRLDLQHNLETLSITFDLFDDSGAFVIADRTEILNTNNVRLFTSVDPDCRFEGKAVIIGI